MSEEKKYPSFNAADIEKYHKGLLTAKEMHALEKAALDDPFLADALEGYAVAGVNATADIEDLKKRLAAKQESSKVIPISAGRKPGFRLLRAAVAIIAIAVAGLLIYQFAFNNNKENAITKSEPKKTEDIKAVDSNRNAQPAITDTENSIAKVEQKQISLPEKEHSKKIIESTQRMKGSAFKADSISYNYSSPDISKASPVATQNPSAFSNLSGKKNPVSNDDAIATRDNKEKLAEIKKDADADGVTDKQDLQKNQIADKMNRAFAAENRAQNQRNNSFRGRVLDPNNNPVPFANVTNTQDNVGTYTDAKGYFNLISPDSVLNVQVHSIGFDNNNVQLRGNVSNNQVVMQEDRSSLNEVVVSNKKPNATARARDGNMKLEEPEPADGWDNYDTYLANNLQVPDEMKTKQGTGNVDVSFEVDKNGAPINIKIERSLCEKCDKEAIRLIKDGPKWKRKIRKGRAIVTIPF